MTVYVDNMFRPAQIQGRPAKWSHMFADSTKELLTFARDLGLRPEWLQHAGTHREHFDVTTTKRSEAIRLGAVQITYPSGVADLIARRRGQCQCLRLPDCRWSDLMADDTNGCCTSCGGRGGTHEGPCWDCRGTGHPHPNPEDCNER